jgi:hypothetical protein
MEGGNLDEVNRGKCSCSKTTLQFIESDREQIRERFSCSSNP